MQRRHFIRALGAIPATAALSAHAGEPTPIGGHRSLRIIVPFAPGGSGDITARMLADFITSRTGQAVVVDNKPGANGIIGVEAARRAPADGSVLMLATTSTHAANPNMYRKLPYDPQRDFELVGHFGAGSMLVLVRPDSAYRTLDDLVAHARAHPGKLNYGFFNASSNVPGAVIGKLAGIRLTPIPYKQINTAMTDLIGGQLDVIFVDSIAGDAFVSSGQLRAIAAHSRKPLPKHPHLPLLNARWPEYEVAGFLGVAVPAGTPTTTLQALNDLVNEAISTAPMKPALIDFGFHPVPMSLAELAEFSRLERARWKEYVEIAGIEPQ